MSTVVVNLLIAGVMVGTLYGLIGVSLTLMLRSSGILSFAHAGFGLVSAYLYAGLECRRDAATYQQCAATPYVPPFVAAVIAVLAAVVVALLVERFVARPLERAATATKVIATAAVLGLISGVLLQIFGPQPRYTPPHNQILPRGTLALGDISISRERLMILVISAALVTVLGLFLRRSWFGLGVRAAGQLPDVSRLVGVSPVSVSRFNWALGGLLSGLGGVLIGPVTIVNIGTFSFLLMKATGASLMGGLVSLPLTFIGGIAIGAVEAIVPHYWATAGSSMLAIGSLLLVMLVVHGKRFSALGYAGAPQTPKPSTGRLAVGAAGWLCAISRAGARVPRLVWIAGTVGVLVFPARNEYYASIGVNALYYCLVALSIVVLTGTTGQLTFMQAGFAAVGAFGLATALHHGWALAPAVLAVTAVCAVTGAAAGWVSLRFRGLEFAVASVALGAVLSEFLVTRPGVEALVRDPAFLGRSLLDTKNLYVVVLVVTAVAMVVVRNLRRSDWCRSLMSMRGMHGRVAHFGVAPVRSEVALLATSAAIAGLAGAVLALTVVSLDPFLFVPIISVTMVLVAVVGGLGSLWGPVLAGLVFGVGQEVIGRLVSGQSANAFPQIAGAALALVLVVRMPGGLASSFEWARAVLAAVSGRERLEFRSAPYQPAGAGSPDTAPRLHRAAGGADPLARPQPVLPERLVRRGGAPWQPGRPAGVDTRLARAVPDASHGHQPAGDTQSLGLQR
jgi:ABC-type branched-subunit amino acid transport system permease subunit